MAHSTFAACDGGTAPELTPGLHATASPNTLIWESPGANLIPAGPRSITDTGRALLLDGNRLVWFDATGSHVVPQLADANEATVDRTGDNIVYVERGPYGGPLHWIAQDSDIPLGLSGSWPALSDDGQTLLFRSLDYKLEIYSLATGTLTEVGPHYSPPAVAGNHAAFAVDAVGRLVRIDLDSHVIVEWLPGPFELSPWTSFPVDPNPPGFYYLPAPSVVTAGPREIVTLSGSHLDTPGWTVSLIDFTGKSTPMNLHIESPVTAWFQIPSSVNTDVFQGSLRSELAGRASRTFDIPVSLADGAFYCLFPVHQGYDRPVTIGDPAHIGEVVHYLLSGLVPIEPVDDDTPNPTDHEIGVVNPPQILEPKAFDVEFLGLAPGRIGYQRLDLGVLAQPSDPEHLFQPSHARQIGFGCKPPAVAM